MPRTPRRRSRWPRPPPGLVTRCSTYAASSVPSATGRGSCARSIRRPRSTSCPDRGCRCRSWTTRGSSTSSRSGRGTRSKPGSRPTPRRSPGWARGPLGWPHEPLGRVESAGAPGRPGLEHHAGDRAERLVRRQRDRVRPRRTAVRGAGGGQPRLRGRPRGPRRDDRRARQRHRRSRRPRVRLAWRDVRQRRGGGARLDAHAGWRAAARRLRTARRERADLPPGSDLRQRVPAGRAPARGLPDGRRPRLIADGLHTPNAMQAGPDGQLYFPAVWPGEVWRIDPAGGVPERVLTDLSFPTAVKFDAAGTMTVTNAGSGEVVQLDLRSGVRSTRAELRPGIDNLAFDRNGRLFVSWFADGAIAEIRADGSER